MSQKRKKNKEINKEQKKILFTLSYENTSDLTSFYFKIE